MFTFTAHANFPMIIVEARQPKKVQNSMKMAFVATITCQTLFAVLGFITYGPSVNQSVNISVQSDFLRKALGFSIILDKLTTFPLVFLPLERMVCGSTRTGSVLAVRAFLFTVITMIGLALGSQFALVVSLVGNLVCSLDAFVFPAVFTFALFKVTRLENLHLILVFIIGCVSVFCGVGADIMEVLG